MAIQKSRIKAETVLNRLTGLSILGLGISRKTGDSDYDLIKRLLVFLEDRRALYVGSIYEQPKHVVDSVLKMRQEITNTLGRIGDKETRDVLRSMRAACHEFLEVPETNDMFRGEYEKETFLLALGKLRGAFGRAIAILAHGYKIDLDPKLNQILPPVVDEK